MLEELKEAILNYDEENKPLCPICQNTLKHTKKTAKKTTKTTASCVNKCISITHQNTLFYIDIKNHHTNRLHSFVTDTPFSETKIAQDLLGTLRKVAACEQ